MATRYVWNKITMSYKNVAFDTEDKLYVSFLEYGELPNIRLYKCESVLPMFGNSSNSSYTASTPRGTAQLTAQFGTSSSWQPNNYDIGDNITASTSGHYILTSNTTNIEGRIVGSVYIYTDSTVTITVEDITFDPATGHYDEDKYHVYLTLSGHFRVYQYNEVNRASSVVTSNNSTVHPQNARDDNSPNIWYTYQGSDTKTRHLTKNRVSYARKVYLPRVAHSVY